MYDGTGLYDQRKHRTNQCVIILGLFEPPVRIFRAALPDDGSHCNFLVLLDTDYSMRYLL